MNDDHGIVLLLGYKAWANRVLFETIAATPRGILEAEQKIVFGSIARTLHHNCAMDEVWQAHLLGKSHGYTSRSPQACPPIEEIASAQAGIDQWFLRYACGLEQGSELVEFTFIGGGPGTMSRFEILMHVVTHTTYHRGHVGAMLYEAGITPPTTDLPVYLRSIR